MRTAGLATLLVLLLAAGPADSRTPKRSHCFPPHSRTVAHNRVARLFVIRHDDESSYYGCLYSVGRVRPVGDNPYDVDYAMTRYRLAGRFVAYRYAATSSQGTAHALVRLDLRSGHSTELDTAYSDQPSNIETFVVAASGAVGWLYNGQRTREIRKLDRDGRATLDSGPDLSRLRLHDGGKTLTWYRGDELEQASLR